jgi:histidinol-phosphate aminotransferase
MTAAPKPRPGIMDIAAYVGGESSIAGVTRVMKLSSNEGALGPSPKAVEAYAALAADLHRYPDGGAASLRDALAARWGLDPACIVCGSGSDELIGLLTKAFAGPGDEVLFCAHGFLMYAIAAKSVGATPVKVPEKPGFAMDVDALLAAVTPRTKILFLANPNNPTGTYLPASEVARLHAGLPSDLLLILDAAYAEYVSDPAYKAGAELVARAQNVVMLRTFSKIYGMAALRLGWGYCSPTVADVLNRVRGPFNVSAAAQAAGAAALADDAFVSAVRAHNDRWLPFLAERLTSAGLTVIPSVGNFLLVQFPGGALSADAGYDYLAAQGIIVRKMGAYGLLDYLRITVGTEEEVRATADALTAFMRRN